MMALLLLALLLDTVVQIAPSSWQTLPIRIDQSGTRIECQFSVRNDASPVDAILLTQEEAERFRQGRSFRAITSSGYQRTGTIRYIADVPGNYVLVIENGVENRQNSQVAVKIDLWRSDPNDIRTVSPERRAVVLILSTIFFGAVAFFSIRRYLAAVR